MSSNEELNDRLLRIERRQEVLMQKLETFLQTLMGFQSGKAESRVDEMKNKLLTSTIKKNLKK